MIEIIAIEREYGSGGGDIAQLVAKRLEWKLWDQQLTDEIARLTNCPRAVVEEREERNDPLYYRLLKSFMRGSYEGSQNAPKLNMVDSETIAEMSQKVVLHAAQKGHAVIVGRGSQHFLRDRADTLRFFLYAPPGRKVARLIARGKSRRDAEELIESVDRDRTDYIRKYFNVEWPNRDIYHALINTAIGDDAVAGMILNFKAALDATSPA
jgi:cytidylate kinase